MLILTLTAFGAISCISGPFFIDLCASFLLPLTKSGLMFDWGSTGCVQSQYDITL